MTDGEYLILCGIGSHRRYRLAHTIRWAATTLAQPTARPWTLSSSCSAPAASGGALDATGICKHSSARRRFQERAVAGVFVIQWASGLQEYDELKWLDWEWLALAGAMTKAPLG